MDARDTREYSKPTESVPVGQIDPRIFDGFHCSSKVREREEEDALCDTFKLFFFRDWSCGGDDDPSGF